MKKFFVITTIFVSVLTLLTAPLQIAAQDLEANKEIARRYLEDLWNKGDMVVADEIIAEDFVNHNPFGPLPPDLEGLKIAAAGSATDPGKFTLDAIIAEGDMVAIHTPYHGDPGFDGIVILRIKDGKITDRWGYTDHAQQFAEANKALIRRYLEALSGKEKPAVIVDEYVADEDEELKQHIAFFEASFPRYELIAEDMIAEGDKVTVHARFQGTHAGALGDIPPTGKQVSQPFIITYRIANGKIVQHWMGFDQLALMQQLGVIPASGEEGE